MLDVDGRAHPSTEKGHADHAQRGREAHSHHEYPHATDWERDGPNPKGRGRWIEGKMTLPVPALDSTPSLLDSLLLSSPLFLLPSPSILLVFFVSSSIHFLSPSSLLFHVDGVGRGMGWRRHERLSGQQTSAGRGDQWYWESAEKWRMYARRQTYSISSFLSVESCLFKLCESICVM